MRNTLHDEVASLSGPPSTTPMVPGEALSLPAGQEAVAVRVIEDGVELVLPPPVEKRCLRLGSAGGPEVDVTVRSARVSRHHATLHRRGDKLLVIDEKSRNGTYVRDHPATEVLVGAGDVFRVGDRHILVLDQALRALRPLVQFALGYEAHEAVDIALTHIASGRPLLLLGRPACGQLELAHAIHRASGWRHGPFAQVPPMSGRAEEVAALALAATGTAFVDLKQVGTVTAGFVRDLFAPRLQLRPIVASDTHARVEGALGKERARGLRLIVLPTLSERRADIPRLFNALFRTELDSSHDIAELGAENLNALVRYDWRGNIAGIRRVLDKVHAYLRTGSVMAAAESLGITHQCLRETFDTLGLVLERRDSRRE